MIYNQIVTWTAFAILAMFVISPDAKVCGFKFLKVQMCFGYFPRCKNFWLRVSEGASVYLLFPQMQKYLASCFSRCKCKCIFVNSPDAKVCGFKCFSCCRNFLWHGRRQSWSFERIFNQPFTSLVNFPCLCIQIELISIVIKHGC